MSKTKVIEVFERTQMVVQIGTDTKGRVTTVAFSADELETLNSDYINEHYGSLQDDAYKRGVIDGSIDVKERVDGAYQKGLEDGKAIHEKGCEGCRHAVMGSDTAICSQCCNAYHNQWTAKGEPFEFGDEIVDKFGIKGCVISRENEGKNTMYALFKEHEVPQCITQTHYHKTGRHFDIEKILEAMKE